MFDPATLPEPLLAEGLADGVRVVAQCRVCGEAATLDTRPWALQRLDDLRLAAFEERVRCLCGGRSARLEIRPAAGLAESGALFVWR